MIIVTGSAKLNVFKRGGDSLMGRYFNYRLHPLSVGEIANCNPPLEEGTEIRPAAQISDNDWEALLNHGGFPEPWSRRDPLFSRRWRAHRKEQLLREDLRDLTRITELGSIEVLAKLLAHRSGEQVVIANLARELNVAETTCKAWIATMEYLYLGFAVKPWYRNIENSIRKTPKWYLRDWSEIEDKGKRFETMVACHLLKAVECWTDIGLGDYELHYVRDKQKREVDFLVSKNGSPWFLVEAKHGDTDISPSLGFMQCATGARHAFQVVQELPFVGGNAFARTTPTVVPARTFLSQLA